MTKQIILIALFVVIGYSSFTVSQARAQNLPANQPSTNTSPTATQPVDLHKPIVDRDNPITENFPQLLSRLINWLVAAIAGASVIFIIFGGFQLAFSRGNTEAISKGKKTITWAIIGLVTALLAFAIIRIIETILFSQ